MINPQPIKFTWKVNKRCKLCGELTDQAFKLYRESYIGLDEIRIHMCKSCSKQIFTVEKGKGSSSSGTTRKEPPNPSKQETYAEHKTKCVFCQSMDNKEAEKYLNPKDAPEIDFEDRIIPNREAEQ